MKNKEVFYKIIRPLAITYMHLVYRPTIIGKENIPLDEGIILCGNHKHWADPVLAAISTNRVVHYLSKVELHKGPLDIIFKSLGCIPVDRKKKNEDAKAKAIIALTEGEVIGIFPEGTRNKTDNILLPFKYGAVSLAKKTKTKIVPFAITGKYKPFRKGPQITFGKPFEVTNIELTEANEKLTHEVEKLILNYK